MTVAAGKVGIEPIAQPPADTMKQMRRAGGRYIAASKKLHLPLKYFKLGAEDSLTEAVWKLLQDLSNKEDA